MAVPERARAQPKFSVLGLGEPFIANICGKWLRPKLNDCFAALADIGLQQEGCYRPQEGRHEWLLRGGPTSRAGLAGLVPKTRIVSVADNKSERGSTKHRTTDKVMAKVAAR